VLQIGQELIQYADRSLTPPYGFRGCRRGHLGTRANPHPRGEKIAHLVRAYGYHMFDMDTTLLDEVTTNFAAWRTPATSTCCTSTARTPAGRPLVLQRQIAQGLL